LGLFDFSRKQPPSDAEGAKAYRDQDFDLSSLESSRFANIVSGLVGSALWRVVFPVMQRVKPVISFRGYTLVVRYDDVKTVLNDHKAFGVPFGEEMEKMTAGPVFALGDDGPEHDLQIEIAGKAWKQDRISATATDVINRVIPAILEDSGGDIDAATDILMRGMSEACIEAFGLERTDADRFAAYATACSVHLFANPGDAEGPRQQGTIGARRIRAILDNSIAAYERNPGTTRRGYLQELMDAQDPGDPMRRDRTRAILFGFITGFVPTVSLASGKILLFLRKHPDIMEQAVNLATEAQKTGNTEKFAELLAEVSRHNPALFPGQTRTLRPGMDHPSWPRHLRKIPPGNLIFVSSAAAMHDARFMKHPRQFVPGKGFDLKTGEPADNLLFGFGFHPCFGTRLANDLIPVILGHLLTRPGIAFSKARPRFFSAYAGELRMTFDVTGGDRAQTMLNALLPLRATCDPDELVALLEEMNGEGHPVSDVFRNSGSVHFSSLTAVNLGPGDNLTGKPTHLIVELNMDGAEQVAFDRLKACEGEAFSPLLRHLEGYSNSFFDLVSQHVLRPSTKPWGTIGVNFPGTSDMSVRQIAAEKELYAATQKAVQEARDKRAHSGYDTGQHEAATDIFCEVRDKLSADPRFRDLFYRPSDRFPAFSRHKEKTYSEFINEYALPRRRKLLIGGYVVATLAISLLVALCSGLWVADLTYVSLWAVPLFLMLTVAGALIVMLRRKEMTEQPDENIAPHDYLARIQARENRPGYVQNHITSVSTLKPGPFRKLTTALAFDLILNMVVHWFRPGFVTDFATIHYARWVRPAGIDKLIFQSNFDGSWESYLEDFITKVHAGQTMSWNNCVGFPKTNWFSEGGAEDGDAFKRWVRLQQVPMQFWYSHFPDLTTGMIRTNAQVRDGLARARTFDEHKAWLSLFESVPNPENAIDTAQVQTLLFRGLGRHDLMKAKLLRFTDQAQAKAWLHEMAETANIADSPTTPDPGRLSFGDSYPNGAPSFLALSASGLEFLGLPDAPFDGIPTLPHAFVDGMARRHFILGDTDNSNAPTQWRWADVDAEERGAVTAHALLLLYARNDMQLEQAERNVALEQAGIECLHEIYSDRNRDRGKKEMAFGFNDGISQPIMKGTQAFASGKSSADDIVGPGEFILGYPDSRGYVPLPLTVSAASPAASCLPSVERVVQGMVAQFGNGDRGLMDFGRNGSFLVIRQFAHNEAAFDSFVNRDPVDKDGKYEEWVRTSAARLPGNDNIARTEEGQRKHKAEWTAAKLFGRWRDGSSLTRNPSVSATTRRRARYHGQVVAALKRLANSEPADRAAKARAHLDKFQEPGPGLPAENSYHVDWSIWSDDEFKRFRRHVEDIETDLDARLYVDYSLLKKIRPDNDFRHGSDDPQGLSCPFGSHIRRSNPRDSFRPGSEVMLEINNRHRLLRRGRTFTKQAEPGYTPEAVTSGWIKEAGEQPAYEEGTFFMCFNANLERQFEFVQQTWVDSRVFHGGREGPDPIVSPKRAGDRFVIPGAAAGTYLDLHNHEHGDGAWDFVKVVAGGYFFMPGRQAIEYLSRI
jgi:deferrochelatase/peroxidase EfeB/cytochrome P450